MDPVFNLILALLFSHCLFAGAASAAPSTPEEKRALVESLAEPLPEAKIFYRWQTKRSGDALLAAETFNEKLQSYFMNMPANETYLRAGRGIYMGEDPYSSSQFARGGDEGSLIEIRVDKGVPYLNTENPAVAEALAREGITLEEAAALDPKLLVKYDQKNAWWVAKAGEGVRFHPFDGRSVPLDEITGKFKELASRRAKRIYSEAVRELLVEKATENLHLLKDPSFRDVLGRAGAKETLASLFHAPLSRENWQALNSIVQSSPLLQDICANEPEIEHLRYKSEARIASYSEIFDKTNLDPKASAAMIAEKLEQSRRAGPYISALKELSLSAKRNPALLLYLPKDVNRLPAGMPKNEEMAARKILSSLALNENAFTEIFRQLPGQSIGPRFAILNRLEQLIREREHSPALNAQLEAALRQAFSSNQKIAEELRSLTALKRAEALREALPHLSQGKDLLEVLQAAYGNDYFDQSLGKILYLERDRLPLLSPTEWRALANYASRDPEEKNALLRKGLAASKNAESFLALLKPGTQDFSAAHERALAALVESSVEDFFSLHPTDEEILKFVRLAAGSVSHQYQVAERSLRELKSPEALLRLLGLSQYWPEREAELLVDAAFFHLENFLQKAPTRNQIAQLKNLLGSQRSAFAEPLFARYGKKPSFGSRCSAWFQEIWH